jgi:hypothetical protein
VSINKEDGEEEQPPAEEIPEDEEGKKDNLSDLSEEEEIKIPPKDLTGKYTLKYINNTYRIG